MSFYEKSGSSASGGTHRRTWDTTEYSIKANERATKEQEEAEKKSGKGKKSKVNDPTKPPPPKRLLEARTESVDLESRIGKQVVLNKNTMSVDTGGYHCEICDCVIKDSINYLDHINGKSHQRNMGYSMKVKRSTVDDIKAKLAEKRVEKEKDKRKKDDDVDEEVREEEAKMADWKRQKREQKNRKRSAPVDEDETVVDQQDDELYKMMGLSGFGGSKKNH